MPYFSMDSLPSLFRPVVKRSHSSSVRTRFLSSRTGVSSWPWIEPDCSRYVDCGSANVGQVIQLLDELSLYLFVRLVNQERGEPLGSDGHVANVQHVLRGRSCPPGTCGLLRSRQNQRASSQRCTAGRCSRRRDPTYHHWTSRSGRYPSLTFFGSNIVIPSIIFSCVCTEQTHFDILILPLMHCKCQTHFSQSILVQFAVLPIRELVRVRARTFCAKTCEIAPRTADFGLFVTFRLFSSTMLKERENCSLNAGHTGIAGSLCNGIGYRTDDFLSNAIGMIYSAFSSSSETQAAIAFSRCQLHLLVDVACAEHRVRRGKCPGTQARC